MIRRIARLFFAALLVSPCLSAEPVARVESFSPSGEVKGVRQVTARFSTPMVSFGDPAVAPPFELVCPRKGSGRWVDSRQWVFDFEHDLPGGVRCVFTLREGVVDLAGAAVASGRFEFSTGGPSVRDANPWDGYTGIDENQVFILGLDAPATDASVARNAWCSIGGRAERVPVRVVEGRERKAILDRQRDFLLRLVEETADRVGLQKAIRARDYRDLPVQLVACRGRLPQDAEVQLVWGRGIETPDGVATSADQTLGFKVRPAFTAKLSCRRTNARGNCIPVLGMSLDFTAPVAVSAAEKITLSGPSGERLPLKISDDERRSGQVTSLVAPGPFPEDAALQITLPPGLVDDGGRPLANAARFPLTVRTDPAPPIAKFAARFGVIELHADPALPITVRNVEKTLAGRQTGLTGDAAVKGLPARLLKVQSPRDVIRWLKRLEGGEARWSAKGYVSNSIFGPAEATTALTVPRPGGEKEFEVIGIPLRGPGFYVVEVVSPRLGQALLADRKPYHVSAGALVTNLAVHFKWGRESSLVWVTSLDRGLPVPAAEVAVMDCAGRVLAGGVTDAQGVLRVRKTLPSQDAVPGCMSQWDKQLFVTARKGADAAFVLSGWDEGISNWRFNLRQGMYSPPDMAVTVFDRTLLRAGETVGMKHFLRRRTGTGFAAVPAGSRPVRMVIRHQGTGQTWEQPLAPDAAGIAESTWAIPADAKLGEYSVTLAGLPKKGEPPGLVSGAESGTFRVEEFRVPVLKAAVQLPAGPLVAASAASVGLQLSYLSGGGAGGQRVKVRALTQPHGVSFDGYEGVNFANGDVREGRMDSSGDGGGTDAASGDEGDDVVEAPTRAEASDGVRPLETRVLGLDAGGGARVELTGLPRAEVPRQLVAEMEYADPNGQILTRSARAVLWPSAVVLGVQPEGWAMSRDKVSLKVFALDTAGRPLAGVAVAVDVFERQSYAHRKRLIGGFYAYEYGEETLRLAEFCSGVSDSAGVLICEAPVSRAGSLILRARARDAAGNVSVARSDVWVAGDRDWWFDVSDGDRMDVVPERRRYEPGETAVLQVRSPFRQASALVTVEREGVLEAFVTRLDGKAPVVKLPLKGGHAPNVFVSVLAVRGRVADVAPTALVDLGKPAFRMGVTELKVGWRAHELAVKVQPGRDVYRVRERAKVRVQVSRPDGKPLPAGAEVAVAAVDEALLELLPNPSWQLLETMMQPRGIEVNASTSVMQVVGRRHYGKKAVPSGGGGGRQGSRELFDTLLLWKARVKLDAGGGAELEVPLNDSLSAFRVVAVASAGTGLFGTGAATLRTAQDVMLLSGLPPVVREQDRLSAAFTVRNASERALDLEVEAEVSALPARRPVATGGAVRSLSLQPGESSDLQWPVTVPGGATALQWVVSARPRSGGAGATDSVKVQQKVVAAVPVRVVQSTLSQLTGDAAISVAAPAQSLADRGGISVQLRSTLAGELAGVRDYMERYPYTCLEQRISRAVALRDEAAWRGLMGALPSYVDGRGLLKYFPSMRDGSDVLTTYVLAVAHEAGWAIPENALSRLQQGLAGFVAGTTVVPGDLPAADLAIRKVAALDALTRHGTALDPALVSSFTIEPDLWPTSAVIDWLGVARRWQELPGREAEAARAETLLRSRLNLQGTTMGFSTERSDSLWWLMVSGDVNANRALLAVMDEPGWREDVPRLVRGTLGRQQEGRWNTTVANAWGSLALERFGRKFEADPVGGTTVAALGSTRSTLDWGARPGGGALSFGWPAGAGELRLRHEGGGRPWVTVTSRAAVPLQAPLSSGYRISRSVTPVAGGAGGWKRGDVARVRLEVEAQSDMTWVVVDDPVPAGAAILGTGLGGDSELLAAGEKREGMVWPAHEERSFEAFRAYYRWVPKGRFVVEYTVRLNNAGTFQLPPTRVEAMYAPEMFGELPNAKMVVGER
jgi:uncharacterized protein YfaS (alpha-2-macroglobulin family)